MPQRLLAVLVAILLTIMAVTASGASKLVPPGLRLLETSPETTVLVTEAERDRMALDGVQFIDITDFQEADPANAPAASPLPAAPSRQEILEPLLQAIDIKYFERNLRTLTYFRNRYYTSPHGIESAQWIFDITTALARPRPEVRVIKFNHSPKFPQPSIIATIPGSRSREVVIIGAHQDSIAPDMPNGIAPGADDDGSGSIAVLEIFRLLLAKGFVPEYTLEFHWYAAEEVGLLGSQEVAQQYQAQQIPVRSMMQLDMIGYDTNSSEVGIVFDLVDKELTEFTCRLVETYLSIPWVVNTCGYACSDHASWNRYGFRSSFPFETSFNVSHPYGHTAQDTIEHIDFDHVREFIRLGLSYVVELSFL